MAPGQDRARVQSKAEWRWASEGWIHSRERQDTTQHMKREHASRPGPEGLKKERRTSL